MYFSIKEALKFPFRRMKGLWNFYWMLIPIVGYFAYMGFLIQVFKSVMSGREDLPEFEGFKINMKRGFFLFIALLVVQIAYMISASILIRIPFIGWIPYTALVIYFTLLMPLLIAQFVQTEKIKDGLDISRATQTMFVDFWGYVIVHLKLLVVLLVLVIASIPLITLIVTIPAMGYSQYYAFAKFYSKVTGYRVVKKVVRKKPRKVVKKKAVKKKVKKRKR